MHIFSDSLNLKDIYVSLIIDSLDIAYIKKSYRSGGDGWSRRDHTGVLQIVPTTQLNLMNGQAVQLSRVHG